MWEKKEDETAKPESPPLGKSPAEQLKELTIIGPSIRIKGTLSGKEDLIILGRVEGKVNLKKNNITVGGSGRIKADVHGRSITIEGEVQGNLFGNERIELRQSGVVRGDMRAPAINLEDGAKFKGNIDMDSKDVQQPTLKKVPVVQDRNLPTKT